MTAPLWGDTPDPQAGEVGVPYVYDFSSELIGTRPITVTNNNAPLPTGLSIVDETIAGTPTASGTFSSIQFRASNGESPDAYSAYFSIYIAPSTGTPATWTGTPTPPDATEGVAYSYDFSSLLSGDPTITVTSVNGALPDGLSIVGHTIAGTPTVPAVFSNLVLRADNGISPVDDSETFSLTVIATASLEPTITNVNVNNTVTSKATVIISGTNLDTVTTVGVGGVALTPSLISFNEIQCDAIDFHTTSLYPEQVTNVLVVNPEGSAQQLVTLLAEAGNAWVTVVSVESTGLLDDFGAIGDIYEGPIVRGIGTCTYYPDGPHVNIEPAPDAGTVSTGWHYRQATSDWEDIDETWNLSEESPVWITIPDKISAYEDMPTSYDITPYVTGGPFSGWGLSNSPANMYINAQGRIYWSETNPTIAEDIVVSVANDSGMSSSVGFSWTIENPLPSYTNVAATNVKMPE